MFVVEQDEQEVVGVDLIGQSGEKLKKMCHGHRYANTYFLHQRQLHISAKRLEIVQYISTTSICVFLLLLR